MDESTTYQDKTLTCVDCDKEFVWSVKEQKFFAEKNFSSPKRCLDCRKKRRTEKKKEGKDSSRQGSRGGRGNRR